MLNKKDLTMLTLLAILLEKHHTTVNSLAQVSGISEKTVRNTLDNLNDFLKNNNYGYIEKKPRIGILLKSSEHQKIQLTKLIDSNSIDLINPDKREREILNLILRAENTIPISTLQIANKLFISVPTVNKSLKEVKKF